MPTNKTQTIKAFLEIAHKYETTGHTVSTCHCSLCAIHYNSTTKECVGCPHANSAGQMNCIFMYTIYVQIPNAIIKNPLRAKYLKQAAVLLENIDTKYFTKKGWTHKAFKELHKLDIKLYAEERKKTIYNILIKNSK